MMQYMDVLNVVLLELAVALDENIFNDISMMNNFKIILYILKLVK